MNVGALTISRVTSTHEADYITVKIRDGQHERIAELAMADFAKALTGHAHVECSVRDRVIPGATSQKPEKSAHPENVGHG